LAATLALILMASVFPFVSLIVAAIMCLVADSDTVWQWRWALGVSAVVVVMLESVIYRFMKLTRAAWWAWLTYPVGAVLGSGMLLSAMRKLVGGRTTWRGTTYRGERRDDEQVVVKAEVMGQVERTAADVA
jgi:chromate transport protein ChrA